MSPKRDSPSNPLNRKADKTFGDSETITYENIRRITIQKPIVKRDKRGGLHKLKEAIYFLREHGFEEKQRIFYDDVEYAIMEVTQGTDPRTIKKYLNLLVKFGYLKPIGQPLSKITRVTVRFNEKVSAKTYSSKKGYSSYVFGIMAPKRYAETCFRSPPSNENERVANMLERVGVTSEKCVRVNDERRETGENRETPSIKRKERKLSHTQIG